jgi:hypothetical protein
MNVLLLASHGIAEYDDIRMFHHLGYDVFCPGGYANPASPGETLRLALPDVPYHADLAALCEIQRGKHPEAPGRYIDWAKADLHPGIIEWADVIIAHHFVREWIRDQWPRIRHKRVVWRTCGQSDPGLERDMAPLHDDGLQIVRYSPAERRYFEAIGAFAGEDALIRFGKFPQDYGPWEPSYLYGPGDPDVPPFVGNVTQNMVERGDAVGLSFWLDATRGLPARPAGPGSQQLPGGVGALGYDAMRAYLRRVGVYLYTGTTPAPYTLGLIEALMTGTPVVSIGREAWAGPPSLFEGAELAPWQVDTPEHFREIAPAFLDKAPDQALVESARIRDQAIDTFGIETIGRLWLAFLGNRKASRTSPWDAVL